MGQSAKLRGRRTSVPNGVPSLSIFPTNLGWWGLVGQPPRLLRVFFGHASADEVRRTARSAARDANGSAGLSAGLVEDDWHPELRRRIERYCLGERVDFDDVLVALPEGTGFQKQVLKCVRRVGYGRTISYGELAKKAGYPRAARAVGTVMSSNRLPVIIPCHRVVAAGGRPGGYSSPQGIGLKLRLLEMESHGQCRDRLARS